MDADLDTLATALYVRVDDLLKCHPEHVPLRPRVGIAPRISDAELVTLAVMQALLDILTSDTDLAARTNQTLIADKNYYGRQFEATLPTLE